MKRHERLIEKEPRTHDRGDAEKAAPAKPDANPFRRLQTRAGNRAVVAALRESEAGPVQPQLTVGAVDDPMELAADRAADQALRRLADPESEVPAPVTSPSPGVRRAATSDTADGVGPEGGVLDRDTSAAIRGATGGKALTNDVRAGMERAFGADFSKVRVHTGGDADRMAGDLSARAFTAGTDLFFRRGEYAPATDKGRQVLAHELAHVVQQGGGGRSEAPVQRLIAPDAFAKKTKLRGRKGKSKDEFQRFADLLVIWQRIDADAKAGPQQKIEFLQTLKGQLSQWHQARGKKSSRARPVEDLIKEIDSELVVLAKQARDERVSAAPTAKESDFDETGTETGKTYGGMMNKLLEVKYDFGVEDGKKVEGEGESFTGLFKAQQMEDEKINQTRAGGSIDTKDVRLVERNMATKAIAELLGAPELIANTFRAKHKGVDGIVMEKVEGVTGDKAEDAGVDPNDPIVRRGLSNLYLLDTICGQVDRHPGNYMIEMKGGKVVGVRGIDNDLAFGNKMKTATEGKGYAPHMRHRFISAGKFVDELTEIDRTMAEKIIALAGKADQVKAALKDLLKADEIDATLKRLESLADFLRPLMDAKDGPVKTEWK